MSDENLGRVMVLGSAGGGVSDNPAAGKTRGVSEIIPVSRKQIDLTDQSETFAFIASKSLIGLLLLPRKSVVYMPIILTLWTLFIKILQ